MCWYNRPVSKTGCDSAAFAVQHQRLATAPAGRIRRGAFGQTARRWRFLTPTMALPRTQVQVAPTLVVALPVSISACPEQPGYAVDQAKWLQIAPRTRHRFPLAGG